LPHAVHSTPELILNNTFIRSLKFCQLCYTTKTVLGTYKNRWFVAQSYISQSACTLTQKAPVTYTSTFCTQPLRLYPNNVQEIKSLSSFNISTTTEVDCSWPKLTTYIFRDAYLL